MRHVCRRISHVSPNNRRGVSLVEVGIAIILIGIITLGGFSIFSTSQIRVVRAMQQDQLTQVAMNEVERLMTLPYAQITSPSVSTPYTLTAQQGGMDFTVQGYVLERSHSTKPLAQVKEIRVVVSAPDLPSYEVMVVRSP